MKLCINVLIDHCFRCFVRKLSRRNYLKITYICCGFSLYFSEWVFISIQILSKKLR